MPGQQESTKKSFYYTYVERKAVFPNLGRTDKIACGVKSEDIDN